MENTILKTAVGFVMILFIAIGSVNTAININRLTDSHYEESREAATAKLAIGFLLLTISPTFGILAFISLSKQE